MMYFHHKPKPKPPRRPRVCVSRVHQITPDGAWKPLPQLHKFFGRARSIHALRRDLRKLPPVPAGFGRLVILSLTVPK